MPRAANNDQVPAEGGKEEETPSGLEKFLTLDRFPRARGEGMDVVISSRVRLARNLDERLFSNRLNAELAEAVLGQVETVLGQLEGAPWHFFHLEKISPLDRQILVEKHLISPQHAQDPTHRGLAIREDQVVSIMVNEEDHLRIQCILPGMSLDEAYLEAESVDDLLEAKLVYAFDGAYGYLTACPTNLGTGLRASLMMHLPVLVLTNQAGNFFHALAKLGMAVRGQYGEGTQTIGNVFQISNQITLGVPESEIIQNLKSIAAQIIDHERNGRETFLREGREALEDRVGRAYGILQNARIINSDETLRLLSDVRLGIEMGLVHANPGVVDELWMLTRAACLQKMDGRGLNPYERDVRRAAIIRGMLTAQPQEKREGE